MWGDGAYQGQGGAIRQAAPQAQDMTSRRVKYKNFVDELQKAKNRVKVRVRAKVEHPFRILKRIFGFEKVRYRGDVPLSPCAPERWRSRECFWRRSPEPGSA